METTTNNTNLPIEISAEILARLPLRSISRFKSVCKTWKSTLESVSFRRRFVSLHRNSSSSWSLILSHIYTEEYIGLYGCETWDLPKSPFSYIPVSQDLRDRNFHYSASSNGLVLMEGIGYEPSDSYVGNPVLQQWIKIPSCPYKSKQFGFVTRVDEDGVVLSFKVLRLKYESCMDVCMYSSETGIWTSRKLHFSSYTAYSTPMSLNGMHYVLTQPDGPYLNTDATEVVAHDFYSESDQLRVIHLPDRLDHYSLDFKRALTTSRGYLMYIKTLASKRGNVLKVWRLNNVGLEDEGWQLLSKTPLPFIQSDIGYYAPMAMHPFDSDIVYIWNQESRCLLSFNLRTQNYRMLRDASERYDDDCFMNQSICQKHMDFDIYGTYDPEYETLVPSNDCNPNSEFRCRRTAVALSHFVLPRWMESIPCPPHVEMIDTTSLLSYIASKHVEDKEGFRRRRR